MSFATYKILHLSGVLMIFLAVGGMLVAARAKEAAAAFKAGLGILHGLGLALVMIAGFGLLAKSGAGFPGWVLVKIIIWLIFGGLIAILKRKPELGQTLLWTSTALGIIAVIMAVAKPF